MAERRALSPIAGLVLVAACSGSGDTAERRQTGTDASSPRLNLVLISVDTLRADRLGAYGYAAAATPTYDRLAAEGVRFDEAWTTAPLTLPAHASLLTGQTPIHHRVRDNQSYRLAEDSLTLAEILGVRGFATGGFVGAFVLDAATGIAQGFTEYTDFLDGDAGSSSAVGYEVQRRGGAVARDALTWIEKQPGPFFAWIHLFDPHDPYSPPPPYDEVYGDRPYDGEVAYTDEVLRYLMRGLDELQHGGDTLVVLVGDHGEALGDHGERRHSFFVYESTIRIPMLFWAPGRLPAGRIVQEPVSIVDVLPTVLGLLGMEDPRADDRDGRDLHDLIDGGEDGAAAGGSAVGDLDPTGNGARPLYAETLVPLLEMGWTEQRAVRLGGFKYVSGSEPQLFDLRADPGETRDRLDLDRKQGRQLRDLLDGLIAADRVAGLGLGDGFVEPAAMERLRSLGYLAAGGSTGGQSTPTPTNGVQVFESFQDGIRAVSGSLAAGRLDAASAAVDQLERLRPEHPLVPYFEGRLALRSGDPAAAVVHLEEALRRAPGYPSTYLDLGAAYRLLGNRTRAESVLRLAWQAFPNLGSAPLLLASHLHEDGRLDEALQAYLAARRVLPRNARLLENLSHLYVLRGETAEAAETTVALTDLRPRDRVVWLRLAQLRLSLGELGEAEAALERAQEIDPTHPEVLFGRGLVAQRRRRPEEAREWFREALDVEPSHGGALRQLAGAEGEGTAAQLPIADSR